MYMNCVKTHCLLIVCLLLSLGRESQNQELSKAEVKRINAMLRKLQSTQRSMGVTATLAFADLAYAQDTWKNMSSYNKYFSEAMKGQQANYSNLSNRINSLSADLVKAQRLLERKAEADDLKKVIRNCQKLKRENNRNLTDIVNKITSLKNDTNELNEDLKKVEVAVHNATKIKFPPGTAIYAINCGGPVVRGAEGIIYQRDPEENKAFSLEWLKKKTIAGALPEDVELFRTTRWSCKGFSYEIPVWVNGTFTLKLKFVEGQNPIKREMKLLLNDIILYTKLNIADEVGKAYAFEANFEIKIEDGFLYFLSNMVQIQGYLRLDLIPITFCVQISAISIITK